MIKEYIIVREDLNMSPGKIAAQCAHASETITTWYCDLNFFNNYLEQGHIKIIKKIKPEEKMMNLYKKLCDANINSFLIEDIGLTELEGKNITVLGIVPTEEKTIEPFVKRLRNL